MRRSKKLNDLLKWIKKNAAGANSILVPISGGSDSALCFFVFSEIYPEKTIGVFAGKASDLRERQWFERIGKVEYTDIPGAYEEREPMRWSKFVALSIAKKAWLVGSRNKTEDLLGTYSIASRVATMLPIAHIWKSDILDLCSEVGIPKAITESSTKADPECGRPKELSEISYEKIESFLKEKLKLPNKNKQKLSFVERKYLDGIYKYNSFKVNLPIRKLGKY